MSAIKCVQCGLVNFAGATQCKRCGTLFPTNVSADSNVQGFVTADGYVLPAPPTVGLPGTGAWRDGTALVMSKDASLPLRCVKCNAFTNERLTRKFSWHHPALYLLLLVAWLIYLIVAMIVRKRATVELGLCEEHRQKRQYFIWTTLVFVLLGVGCFVMAIMADDGTPALIGFLLLLTALIFGLVTTRVGYPSKIDDRFVWIKGINAEYLQQFPAWPRS